MRAGFEDGWMQEQQQRNQTWDTSELRFTRDGQRESKYQYGFFYSDNLYLSQVRMPGARPGGGQVNRGSKEQAMEGVGQLMMVDRIM